MSATVFQTIAVIVYLVAMVMVGLLAYNRTENLDDYIPGGRRLGPIVTAPSAGATDVPGWLLMGPPDILYVIGLLEGWTVIGLTIGTWLNWKFTVPRLHAYSQTASDSTTIPSFSEECLRDTSKSVRIIAGIVITIFLTLYISSGMVAGEAFFGSSFGMSYHLGIMIVAVVTVLCTLAGDFLVVSQVDVVRGFTILIALVAVPVVDTTHVGGFDAPIEQVNAVDPTVLPFTHGNDAFSRIAILGIISALAWGLDCSGQPHTIIRLVALCSVAETKQGRRISVGRMVPSTLGAGLTAPVDITVCQHDTGELASPEGVFITLGQMLFHSLIAGFMLAAILVATMSIISSQFLVTSSALVENIYHASTRRELSGANGVLTGRLVVGSISLIAAALTWLRPDTILSLVTFAWAEFGAPFGPIVLLSFYWRKPTAKGIIAGVITGAPAIGIRGNISGGSGGTFDLYGILLDSLLSPLTAVLVSQASYRPNAEIQEETDWIIAATRGA